MSISKKEILAEIKSLSFEDSLSALETIVSQLETGRIKLEDAVKAYEKGVLLKHHCEEKLQEAKMRIEKISLSQNGEVIIEPLEDKPQE